MSYRRQTGTVGGFECPGRSHRSRSAPRAALVALVLLALAAVLGAGPAPAQDGGGATAPTIEFAERDEGLGARWSRFLIDFQRRANAEVARHMNAIERGDDLGAFFLGLAIAFVYGVFHAFGPGHGKFVIVSYFLGREVRVARGVAMAVQVAIVHVIAAIVIVWLADIVLRAGFGVGLAQVPGVRAASFLIIAAIGLYMLYQAVRAALGYVDAGAAGHGHSHGHAHSHGHSHSHGHGHARDRASHRLEGGLMAFAAGVVPCPGAVLIMLYAVANDMIYPGFVLVAAMSAGIGLTICTLGVAAILARRTAMGLVERGGGGGAVVLRHGLNFGGAVVVTAIGLVSFVAFLDVPLG